MRARVVVGAVATAAVGVLSSCTARVTDLGGAWSDAYGINASGIVVGASARPDPSVPGHAFKRYADNTTVDLGTRDGDVGSVAWDVNDAGTIVGESGGPSGSSVVRWDAANHLTDLGFDARPRDINDAGVFVGHSWVLPGRARGHAFVYDPAVGHPVALPELPGAIESSAWGLNDEGLVVGTVSVPDASPGSIVDAPVLWDLAAGTVTDLRSRLGVVFLAEIGDDGTIVGQSGSSAAVWSPGAWLSPTPVLPTILPTGGFGAALGINDSGTVVGNGPSAGFRWRADTGLVWLGTSGTVSHAFDIDEANNVVGYAAGANGIVDRKAALLYDQAVA